MKQSSFGLLRYLPFVENIIKKEKQKIQDDVTESIRVSLLLLAVDSDPKHEIHVVPVHRVSGTDPILIVQPHHQHSEKCVGTNSASL